MPERAAAILACLQEQVGGCREEIHKDGRIERCWQPAEFVLWGKLVPPEGLGPRCYGHAAAHVGHYALARRSGYALVNLPELADSLEFTVREVDAGASG